MKRPLGAALLTWGLIFASCPGVLLAEGSALLAAVALVPWGLACGRAAPGSPGARRTFLGEWLGAAAGCGALMAWAWYVWPPGVFVIGLGQGLYATLAGVLLRRLRPALSLTWAVPLAWVGAETFRAWLPTPPSLGWWRLGHALHGEPWLAGSARVVGVLGLSFALAAVAGGLAELLHSRRPARALPGLLPLLAAALLARAVPAPETRPGPRVLLVQPAFPQERKATRTASPLSNFESSALLTAQGLAELAERGQPPPDLVAWGETMLYVPIVQPGLGAALEGDLEVDDWYRSVDARWVRSVLELEEELVGGLLFGRPSPRLPEPAGVLPPGTSFLSGFELYGSLDGRLRRWNALAVWDAGGQRSPAVGKTRLVPGAEGLVGLERFAAVRSFTQQVAGYLPDFAAFDEPGVLELVTRDGERYRFGGSVCFDNAFLAPYTEPLRRGPVDFHLVVSNEAWYRDSYEMDQMLAFSRLIAIATGRAVVRATNGGLTVVVGPDGRDLARLVVGGRDRNVPGTLAAQVPVPRPGEAAARTPFVRLEPWWQALAILGPVALAAALRRRDGARNPGSESG